MLSSSLSIEMVTSLQRPATSATFAAAGRTLRGMIQKPTIMTKCPPLGPVAAYARCAGAPGGPVDVVRPLR